MSLVCHRTTDSTINDWVIGRWSTVYLAVALDDPSCWDGHACSKETVQCTVLTPVDYKPIVVRPKRNIIFRSMDVPPTLDGTSNRSASQVLISIRWRPTARSWGSRVIDHVIWRGGVVWRWAETQLVDRTPQVGTDWLTDCGIEVIHTSHYLSRCFRRESKNVKSSISNSVSPRCTEIGSHGNRVLYIHVL